MEESFEKKVQKLLELKGKRESISEFYKILNELSDEEKFKAIDYFEDDIDKSGIVFQIKNIDMQVEATKKINDKIRRADTIGGIEDPEVRIKHIDEFDDLFLKYLVLNGNLSISDDEILQNIGILKNERSIAVCFSVLESDERKKEEYKTIKDEKAKAILLSSVKDTKFVEGQLKSIKNKEARALVVAGMSRPDDKEKYLEKFQQKYSRLNLGKYTTIGMEIESEGEFSNIIDNISEVVTGWKSEKESSLDLGVEIVSPVLRNNEDDIRGIYYACENMKQCGQIVSQRCGGHIHIGSDILKSKEAYINLLQLWCNTEEIMYLISNEEGDIPRNGVSEFAKPISKKVGNALREGKFKNVNSKEELISVIKEIQDDRYSGINFDNVEKKEKDTIEFRMSNGTLNPNHWIENIDLFGGMIEISQKIAEIKGKKAEYVTQEEQSLVDLFEEINSGRLTEEEKLNHLLKLIIPEEQREVYLKKYSINKSLAESSKEFNAIKENISENTIDIPKQKIFTEQQIGKATVNIPTIYKEQAQNRQIRDEQQMVKKGQGNLKVLE